MHRSELNINVVRPLYFQRQVKLDSVVYSISDMVSACCRKFPFKVETLCSIQERIEHQA